MRILISHILSADPDIEVIGAIPDISLARERIPRMQLDVITFNAAMAGWESTAALNELVRTQQIPVVVLGSRTHPEWFARYAMLDPRRVHYLPLPGASSRSTDPETSIIVASVRSAARRGRMDKHHKRASREVDGSELTPDHRDRRLDGWNSSDRRGAEVLSRGRSRHGNRAAYAPRIHEHVRQAPEQRCRRRSKGSR
jgi:chemotaxis response regulator CheB